MADQLLRTLASCADAQLRIAWLGNWLSQADPELGAQVLEGVLERAETFDPSARCALIPLASWLAGAVDQVQALRLLLEARRAPHYRLGRLLHHAENCEVDFEQVAQTSPVPDYRAGRPLSLGERKGLARVPTRKRFDSLLLDPHPAVLEKLLQNPRLTESDVLRVVAQRPARVELQALVARSPRWILRARIRTAIALNPLTPPWQSVPLLSTFNRQDLKRVLESPQVPVVVRECAREHHDRHPPVPTRLHVLETQ